MNYALSRICPIVSERPELPTSWVSWGEKKICPELYKSFEETFFP